MFFFLGLRDFHLWPRRPQWAYVGIAPHTHTQVDHRCINDSPRVTVELLKKTLISHGHRGESKNGEKSG